MVKTKQEPEILREFSPPTTCNVLHVTYWVSCVISHVLHVRCPILLSSSSFLDKVVELVGGGSVMNGAYPVYLIKIAYENSDFI